ncbi:MAG TPA: hypothetical protein VEQ10_14700, partial [Vicinamibacteria bacterium]|nr:hypothetical protein [Vicinamibacteria bacterium]
MISVSAVPLMLMVAAGVGGLGAVDAAVSPTPRPGRAPASPARPSTAGPPSATSTATGGWTWWSP